LRILSARAAGAGCENICHLTGPAPMIEYHADFLWTESGFVPDARVAAVGSGNIDPIGRFVVPGMCNAHSHAFQRAMAGLAEHQTHADDSFWTWRETMYRFAHIIGPDDLRAIATQLYVEMLEAGYTSVCEFHYLHHQPDGSPYADPSELSRVLIAAARDAGIRMTLLPVLYMTGGFDGRALSSRQQRFGHSVDAYLDLLQNLRKDEDASLTVGACLHSLRAVPEDAMHALIAAERSHDRPIHIHIAEQMPEVDECIALRGQRPVAWLLDHAEIDARWTLVHATHLDDGEVRRLARSGATVAICPTTEANLGDGLFALKPYLDANGSIAIGSDSHVSISVVEELRWLEYGQRLRAQRRNIAVGARQLGVGEYLFAQALRGGLRAAGQRQPAAPDPTGWSGAVVLDDQHPLLIARDNKYLIDTWIFSGNVPLVRDVIIDSAWLVRDGRHRARDRVAEGYRVAMRRLAALM
jgi:formimidoylglutamate deiminase